MGSTRRDGLKLPPVITDRDQVDLATELLSRIEWDHAICEVYPGREYNEWHQLEQADAVRVLMAALQAAGLRLVFEPGNNPPKLVPHGDGGAKETP